MDIFSSGQGGPFPCPLHIYTHTQARRRNTQQFFVLLIWNTQIIQEDSSRKTQTILGKVTRPIKLRSAPNWSISIQRLLGCTVGETDYLLCRHLARKHQLLNRWAMREIATERGKESFDDRQQHVAVTAVGIEHSPGIKHQGLTHQKSNPAWSNTSGQYHYYVLTLHYSRQHSIFNTLLRIFLFYFH